jgi:hypothetical protein
MRRFMESVERRIQGVASRLDEGNMGGLKD